MIGYLKGTVQVKQDEGLIVLVGGVGYAVCVPASVFDGCQIGETVELLVYTHVREDELALFGFAQSADRKMFVSLLGVSGIGPRLAMAVMSQSGGAFRVIRAIQEAEVDFFTSIKGLGKKGAQRLIVDLKPKVGGLKELDFESQADQELVEALEGLGFSKKEIVASVKDVSPDLSLEDKLRLALKKTGEKDD